ncbi:MAG: hypothetical protein BWY09_01923 [Candidatus Hydrogenedentes bacterium ADurb.Bin179]|nr:MAG: hypothetical protein BWY09_01923 [Candidatus Hydrogenedentes bacterium ADurb.Bin179]
MGVNILNVFRIGIVNVSGQVEIEIVLRVADFACGHHARIPRHFHLAGKGVHNAVDVPGTEPVFVAVFHEPLGGVYHEDAFTGMGVFFVQHKNTGGDAGAIKEIGRQSDDSLDIATPHDFTPDDRFRAATEQYPVGMNHGAFAGTLQAGENMEQEGIIAVLGGRDTERKASVNVVGGVEPAAPRLVGKGEIGNHIIEGLQFAVCIQKIRTGQRIILPNFRRGTVMENHVHTGESRRGIVHLLAVQRQVQSGLVFRFVMGFQQQRTGTAGGVVDGLVGAFGFTDADDLGHHTGNLRRGIELALALAGFRGKIAHQVFIGIAKQVVAVGTVAPELQPLENGHEVGQTVHHGLAPAQFICIIEIRQVNHTGQAVRLRQPVKDLVDAVANLLVALQRRHGGKTTVLRHLEKRPLLPGILVRNILDEQQHQHIILVLGRIHPAAQFIAAFPQGSIQFRFLQRHTQQPLSRTP